MMIRFIKRVKLLCQRGLPRKSSPLIIPRSEHGVSRKNISENALKVLYRLHRAGYKAYLVGGSVRDLLLGLHPKDFDVVTNAKPEEVREVFRNCRLIGRRFRLAHVYFGPDIIEVATFRGKSEESDPQATAHSAHGLILRDNVYGTLEQDVWRRDFTINALYYNIADFSIVDYVGGYADLKAKRLRMIGEVEKRYREDPVRILRAIRFACKVNFVLPPSLTRSFAQLIPLIEHVPPSRLFEEILKMFHSGNALAAYTLLKEHHLFEILFPATASSLSQNTYPTDQLLKAVFLNTDNRIKAQKHVTPVFIVAALLWYPICLQTKACQEEGMELVAARWLAIDIVLKEQLKHVSIPKRITQGAQEVWHLQDRFHKQTEKRASVLISEPRFRAAFDFLELRAKAGEPLEGLVTWWRNYLVSC